MAKIQTKWLADDSVTKEKVNADVAGDGLAQAAGGELDVNVDDATLETNADIVRIKDLGVGTAKLAATSVTAAKLGSDVAGDGLTGGNGADLDVDPDSTGGANLARAVNVSANGVAVKIDDDTIVENGSQQLAVGQNSIGANEVDETDNYTWSGTNDFTGGSITVPAPSSGSDAVTKTYADSLRAGNPRKGHCRAVATSNLAVTGDPGTVDGVGSWSTGHRILLTNQTSGAENGIWVVNTAGAWTRPTDFVSGDNADGAMTWIDQGSTYGDTGNWVCHTNSPNDVIDTDSLDFQHEPSSSQTEGGTGLTKSGNIIHVGDGTTGDINGINRTANELAVAPDGTTLELSAHKVQIKDLGVGTPKLAATSVTAAKLGSDVAGDGLTGGNGSDLDVQPDATGGANLAKVVNVSANGVAVKVDDTSVEENGSGQLGVKDNGIDENKLNTSVAGEGLTGGGGSALDLDVNGLVEDTAPDNADFLVFWDVTEGVHNKVKKSDLLAGASSEQIKQEMHLITAGEDTNGYFTLSQTPSNDQSVRVSVVGGPRQVNKAAVGATGATPDFEMVSNTQLHFNNNGAGTGLSEEMESGDTLIIEYHY
jgi:hypothetical protein